MHDVRMVKGHCAFRCVDGLVDRKFINARDLARFCALTFGYLLFDLSSIDLATPSQGRHRRKLCSKHEVDCLGKAWQPRLAGRDPIPPTCRALDEVASRPSMSTRWWWNSRG